MQTLYLKYKLTQSDDINEYFKKENELISYLKENFNAERSDSGTMMGSFPRYRDISFEVHTKNFKDAKNYAKKLGYKFIPAMNR